MAELQKIDRKRKWINRLVMLLIILFLLLDIYVASFFILIKPRHDLYQIEKESDEVYLGKYGHPLAYAAETFVYISEDKRINTTGYYFYWPIHMPLGYTGHLAYVEDPNWHKVKAARRIKRRMERQEQVDK